MNRKGFTLVELVVVITIIGIMTTVGIVSYRNTLKETRDQKRIVNLQSIRSAIELFRSNDPNSVYPAVLSEIETAYTLPVDPSSGLTDVYTYLPTTIDGFPKCDNTPSNYCATYTLRTNLETMGLMYEVTPNSEKVLQASDFAR